MQEPLTQHRAETSLPLQHVPGVFHLELGTLYILFTRFNWRKAQGSTFTQYQKKSSSGCVKICPADIMWNCLEWYWTFAILKRTCRHHLFLHLRCRVKNGLQNQTEDLEINHRWFLRAFSLHFTSLHLVRKCTFWFHIFKVTLLFRD